FLAHFLLKNHCPVWLFPKCCTMSYTNDRLRIMKIRRLNLNTTGSRPEIFDRSWRILLPALFALLPLAAFGLGSRIPNQDAAAIARGNAFVATADNPTAMYYNPAGISQLDGQNFQVGSLFYLNIYA